MGVNDYVYELKTRTILQSNQRTLSCLIHQHSFSAMTRTLSGQFFQFHLLHTLFFLFFPLLSLRKTRIFCFCSVVTYAYNIVEVDYSHATMFIFFLLTFKISLMDSPLIFSLKPKPLLPQLSRPTVPLSNDQPVSILLIFVAATWP